MVTYEAITKLDEYKDLLALGCVDTTSDLMKERSNLRFTNPSFGKWGRRNSKPQPGTVTVYANGYVRTQYNETPTIVKSFGYPPKELKTIQEWEYKLNDVRKYVMKKILKEEFSMTKNVKDITDKDTLGKSLVEFLNYPNLFTKWFLEQTDTTQGLLLSVPGIEERVVELIEENPTKLLTIFKKSYKEPAVRKIIGMIKPSMRKKFIKDLELVGNLGELGF